MCRYSFTGIAIFPLLLCFFLFCVSSSFPPMAHLLDLICSLWGRVRVGCQTKRITIWQHKTAVPFRMWKDLLTRSQEQQREREREQRAAENMETLVELGFSVAFVFFLFSRGKPNMWQIPDNTSSMMIIIITWLLLDLPLPLCLSVQSRPRLKTQTERLLTRF